MREGENRRNTKMEGKDGRRAMEGKNRRKKERWKGGRKMEELMVGGMNRVVSQPSWASGRVGLIPFSVHATLANNLRPHASFPPTDMPEIFSQHPITP